MKKIIFLISCIFISSFIFTQNSVSSGSSELPVKRIALFSSGVGYFEHSGTISGSAELTLTFEVGTVNDALKSLVVNDSGQGASPSVSYPSEDTLMRTLQSLGIDLSRNPGVAEIFASQRGAEIEISAPNPISGRILGVELRSVGGGPLAIAVQEAYLSLYTGGAVRVIAIKDIASFNFKDSALNADLKRALDLIAANRTSRNRSLLVNLPGNTSRSVSLSYVIGVPVWKVSYRLDLGQSRPLFQGWAIIDNNSDTDWNNIELSLVSGRPVSFIQQLYPPYYFTRPTLPLAIAGSAQAGTYAGGYDRQRESALVMGNQMMMDEAPMEYEMLADSKQMAPAPQSAGRSTGGGTANVTAIQAAATGSAAGDQFAFTVKNPVTLNRRQSAMIPMVSGNIGAVKTLVLSGARALNGSIHPDLAAELTNTTGMKLPAGPITVFDGGSYAGDALIEFFGENDKRLIKYGEDLSVTGTASLDSGTRLVSSVQISGGVMVINRRQIYERTYTVKNTNSETKRLIIEHTITGDPFNGSTLVEPKNFLEKTDSLYRFEQTLRGNSELVFKVREEVPVFKRITLSTLRIDSLLSYSTNQEIPNNIRTALSRAVDLRRRNDSARQTQTELQTRRTRLVSEQDRVRQNLNSVGTGSDLGKEYMRRMTELDREIESLIKEEEKAADLVRSTQKELDDYIAGLKLL
ncbi:MAG: DUF4139 domain-containing protein [Treponema sp.]|jgi:hypothetical protein|nr:DUF4139 domain-containing protein [Treponema sp.]